MKTIKQIANEIGVTKQALQKRIAREPLCTRLSPYISTQGGTKYIDETGETLIKSQFNKMGIDKGMDAGIDTGTDASIDKGIDVHTPSTHLDSLLTLANEQQKTINEQQKTIQELAAANRELTAALEHTTSSLHAAQALHAGTMRQQLTDGADGAIPPEDPKTKKSFLDRIFKSKK